MTTTSPTPDAIRAKLDDRYGRSRGRVPRWVVGVGIAAVVLVIGWFGWMTVTSSLESVTSDTTGFEVIDEHLVSVSFQLTAPSGREVACAVEAQDEQHGIVGWKVIVLPGSTDHTRAFTERVPTVAAATTGLINSCWVT